MERGLSQILDEMLEMPEFKRLERIRHFQFSIRLLERNACELLDAIDRLTAQNAPMEILAVSNRSKLHAALEEVMHRLHNFVSSVLSLIDHARVLTRELYPGNEFPDYEDKVTASFKTNPLAQFVKDLRQFAQHYKLPAVGFTMEFANDGATPSLTRTLNLSKADLLGFSNWSSAAKQYLASASEKINLRDVVERYRGTVREFYRWMGVRQQELHAADIAAVEAKKAEGKQEIAKDIPAYLQAMLQHLGREHGDIRTVFAVGLGPQDYDKLSGTADDAEWVEGALAIFADRFGPLPEALATQLREAATGGP